jgi:hypothetical protein
MNARTKDEVARDLVIEAQAARELVAALQSDDDQLNADMVEGETGLFEAIDAALSEIDDCDAVAMGCDEKCKQLQDRKAAALRRQERLRGLIEQAMLLASLEKIKRPCATITVAAVPPKPVITDEAAIPAQYWRQPDPVLDKTAINAASKDGATIPGVTMSNGGTSLRIRRV